jgi:DNA-binding NarL/FixJ family response regulator
MIRVFVVANVRLFREGVASFLEMQPGISVVGAAEPVEAAALLPAIDPEIVLLDVPDRKNLQAVRWLSSRMPGVKVVAIGAAEMEDDLIAFARVGIAGYVLRDGSLKDLLNAIEAAARDEFACSPAVAAMLLRCLGRQARVGGGDPGGRLGALSHREVEIVTLIGQDLSNKQIATCLHLALSTVKNHVHNAMQKLDTSSRGEIAVLAQDAGLAPQRAAGRAVRI